MYTFDYFFQKTLQSLTKYIESDCLPRNLFITLLNN